MSLLKYIERMKRMDRLINMKATGTPDEFSEKMGVCKSVLMENLAELRAMGAEITYDRERQSYTYTNEARLVISYDRNNESNNIRGGKLLPIFLNPIIPE